MRKVQQGTVQIDDFSLNYAVSESSSDTTLFVIGSALYYGRLFSENLQRRYRMIFVDHRGFARCDRSDVTAEDGSLDRIVEDIEHIRRELQIERIIAVGHSGHAFMATAYAEAYPEHVQALALLNTAPDNSEARQHGSFAFFLEHAGPERKGQFEKDMADLEAAIANEPGRRFAHLMTRMRTHSYYDFNVDAAAHWEGLPTQMPIIDHLWGDAFARIDLKEKMVALSQKKPVFLGLGRYDYLVAPVSLWDDLATSGSVESGDRFGITKLIFEKSGHNPMFEEPDLFDDVFGRWIDACAFPASQETTRPDNS